MRNPDREFPELNQPPGRGMSHATEVAALIADLKAERVRQGLSQWDVAIRSGLDERAVRNLETGKSVAPFCRTLLAYGAVLGLKLSWSKSTTAATEVEHATHA
jgi:transcriptional regulator with XRE-family HTH domain